LATNVIMPALGVAQQTGTLLRWLKSEGEAVAKGEPLMEIETDKATVEIEAAGEGVLSNVKAKPGDVVPVGQTIALLLAPGEKVSTEAGPHPIPLPEGEGRGESRKEAQELRNETHTLPLGEGRGEGAFANSAAAIARSSDRVLASPKARRIAKEKQIDLKMVRGSGPEGSVLTADVMRATSGVNAAMPSTATELEAKIVPLTPMRRIVGQRMTQSKQSAPHFYISMDIDMTAVDKLRGESKLRGDQVIPSINDFILYACARTLKDFRSLNATFTEQGIKLYAVINLGVAVALEEGLVVPVIRDADRLNLNEIARQSRELADKAQNKKLFPLDYEGGTFTVSNLGMLGVDSFVAIINPPQSAILAVGRVAPRVVADDGMFAIKPIMTATLSADHRVVDGALAARFLQAVRAALESPNIDV